MSTSPHTKLFTQVDRTGDPDLFVRFMDEAQRPEGIQASKRLMLEGMGLTQGEAVLEVGCGPGTDVFELVELVGPTGRLVGLDASQAMIAEARRRAGTSPRCRTGVVGDGPGDPRRPGRRLRLSPGQARRWWDHLQHADKHGTLLIGFTTFIAVGTWN